jgi:hypothetical protein
VTVALNFPTNKKIVGENLNSISALGNWLDWTTFGTWWPDLQKAIDHAYAIGCNTVRMVSDVRQIKLGQITQAQHDGIWSTILDYTDRLGLYVYPCFTGNDSAAATPVADMISYMSTTLGTMSARTKIIGADLCNEGNWGTVPGAFTSANAKALIVGVRANVPTVALTISTTEAFDTVPTWLNDTGFPNGLVWALDFIDFHMYNVSGSWGSHTSPTVSMVQANPFTWYPFDIIFGEYGGISTDTDPVRRAWCERVTGLYAATNSGGSWLVRGGLHWNIYDQDPSQKWGAFDTSWAPYSALVQPLANVRGSPGTPAAPVTPLNPRTGVLAISPEACSNDFANVKIYKDGSLVATQGHGYYEDAAMNDRTGHTYKASVVNGSSIEGSQSTALVTPNSPCKGLSGGGAVVTGS